MGGRAFAVNYRLAPQYPFPCALADCLAAYLYLIRPPENAKLRVAGLTFTHRHPYLHDHFFSSIQT
jgi:acetyl esterase/lipase